MLKSLFSAFLMYSRIPAPQVEWKEENRRYTLGFFPLIGAVICAIEILWYKLADYLSAGAFLYSAIAVFIPVLVTGGIHIDGFCDVTDARASYADSQKRLEILSDPHIGSFAVINLSMYFLIQTALFSQVNRLSDVITIGIGYVLSRALSGFSAITFKSAKKEGTLQSFVLPSHRNITLAMEVFYIVLSFLLMSCFRVVRGALCLIAALAVLFYCKKTAYRDFGGITGDVCGWFLQLCELFILAAVVFYDLITEVVL